MSFTITLIPYSTDTIIIVPPELLVLRDSGGNLLQDSAGNILVGVSM